MREIKFRAWDKFNEVFLNEEDYAINFVGTVFQACLDEGVFNIVDNKNIILMQFTGLKDKNGVEIYEGDICIIKKCFTNGIDKLSDHLGEIKYTDDCHFMVIDKYLNSISPYEYKNNIENIGNIYENLGILEKNK